jgi:hypothetical protein
MNLPTFSQLVGESWEKAVGYASGYIEHYKDELLIALTSNNPEERSAAVTSFNEAGDSGVHDLIITLIDDPDQWVRHEVLALLSGCFSLSTV